MFKGKIEKTAAFLVAIFALVSMVGVGAAYGAYDVDSTSDSIEAVSLAEGSTTDYTFDTDDTNSKDVRWKDANGNLIHEKTGIATTTDSDGNDIVEVSLQDDNLINDGTYPVEDGDEVTIEVYDSTDAAVDQTVTQKVDFTADASFAVTDSVVTNNEDFDVASEDGISFLVESYDVASVEKEFVFSDADMDQDQREATVQISDSEVLTQFENAQTDRGLTSWGTESVADGEALEGEFMVEGEEVDVYLNQAPEDHDGPHTVVYDASQEQVEITTTSDKQGLEFSGTANEFSLIPDFGVQERIGL